MVKTQNRKWNGRDIVCDFFELDDKYDCDIHLILDGNTFHGTSLTWNQNGRPNIYSFDSDDTAFLAAVSALEANLIKEANGIFVIAAEVDIENLKKGLKVIKDRQILSQWLTEKFCLK